MRQLVRGSAPRRGFNGTIGPIPSRMRGYSGVPVDTLEPDHGSTDGQPRGSSAEDIEEDQDEKERIERERKRKQREEAEDGTPVGSPGSERGAIGPMGDTSTTHSRGKAAAALNARAAGLASPGMKRFRESVAAQAARLNAPQSSGMKRLAKAVGRIFRRK